MAEHNPKKLLVAVLRSAVADHSLLSSIEIASQMSDVRTLADLCQEKEYEVIEDESSWNPQPGVLREVIAGMPPDIVLRSKSSGQNRIYINLRERSSITSGVHDSLAIRHFLHLLGTSDAVPGGQEDVRRALLLHAMPSAWFEGKRSAAWSYFMDRYSDLARSFDITLGEIRLHT